MSWCNFTEVQYNLSIVNSFIVNFSVWSTCGIQLVGRLLILIVRKLLYSKHEYSQHEYSQHEYSQFLFIVNLLTSYLYYIQYLLIVNSKGIVSNNTLQREYRRNQLSLSCVPLCNKQVHNRLSFLHNFKPWFKTWLQGRQ